MRDHPGAAPSAETLHRLLAEDVGPGDLTAALLPEVAGARATVIAREPAVICGTAWFGAVFHALDPAIRIDWQVAEGARVTSGTRLCQLEGRARPLVTGERTALNLLQTLSGTATSVSQFANALKGTRLTLLDTRKTLPGLRLAQKYAVVVGGGCNHRMGLYDGLLIKENHIRALGSISAALEQARTVCPAGTLLEIEVETLDELTEALAAGGTRILLDNFTAEDRMKAVALAKGRATLEVSGNVLLEDLPEIARSGVDYVSIGALTKHLKAIDLSMLIQIDADG